MMTAMNGRAGSCSANASALGNGRGLWISTPRPRPAPSKPDHLRVEPGLGTGVDQHLGRLLRLDDEVVDGTEELIGIRARAGGKEQAQHARIVEAEVRLLPLLVLDA